MNQILWTAPELQALFKTPVNLLKPVTGVSIDSRTLQPGDLFIALRGPIVDGHTYVRHAQANGATAALVEQRVEGLAPTFPQICVQDTFSALQQLGRAARQRAVHTQIVGITGSFGKTSVREALRHVLSTQGLTYASARNFNNQWGVPLSAARLPWDSRFALFELGMNHKGEIAPLSELIQPHMALITTIGHAHIGHLGSLENIAEAKAEIFQGMTPGQIAILNRDNPQYSRLAHAAHAKGMQILSFGHHAQADCQLKEYQFNQGSLHIQADIDGQPIHFKMNVLGDHWAINMTGVLACVYALGQDVRDAAAALESFSPLEGRGAIIYVPYQNQTLTIIDDSYNGGPQAMWAALQALGRLVPQQQGRRIAVLGDMAELGQFAIQEHQALAPFVQQNRVDLTFLYGPYMRYLQEQLPPSINSQHFESIPALITSLLSQLQPGDCILVKGGHGQRAYDGIMQQVVVALQHLAHEPCQKVRG